MVQGRAAGLTVRNFDNRASVTEVLNNLGWIKLEQRRAVAGPCLFYKIFYGLGAVPLPNLVIFGLLAVPLPSYV